MKNENPPASAPKNTKEKKGEYEKPTLVKYSKTRKLTAVMGQSTTPT